MISREQILERIRTVMHEMFELDPASIQPGTNLIDDLGLDSIDAIDLAARLEELTGERLGEDALRKLRTVADVVDLVETTLLRATPF